MAEVGSLQIGGSVDTQAIENGLTRIEGGLKNVAAVGDSVNSDFVRINQNAKDLGKSLSIMAVAGVTAMLGIAKGAPAVAGSMAKMKVSFGKLTRTLGEALKPAFDSVAESFNGFVGWVSDHSGTISSFTTEILGDLGSALGGIRDTWNWLSSNVKDIAAKIGIDVDVGGELVDKWGLPAAMGILTKVFTKGKVGFGAAAITTKVIMEAGETITGRQGVGEGIGSIAGSLGGAWAGAKGGAALGTLITPGVGTAIGGVAGAVGGAIFGDALFGWIGRKFDNRRNESLADYY